MSVTHSKTKIIATIGPASSSKDVLRKMIQSGVDVCRLNFSHGTHQQHAEVIQKVREINKELDVNVALLADLQGPKLRIGELEDKEVELISGEIIKITTLKCKGTSEQVYLNYDNFPVDVEIGDTIMIDDGKLKLEVVETDKKQTVQAKIIHGGILRSRKGVNLPNTKISLPSLTPKDIKDAHFALEQDVDWIALSFVRSVTDIVELKQLIKHSKRHASVVAKIEKPEALAELDNIIDMTDAIMVARGDLGVEVAFNKIPVIQKKIVEKCIDTSKPVIIATQMMESMITNFRPTRAEATDVANAVIDGADTVMLSGETSIGKYPVRVIDNMHELIQYTEANAYHYNRGIAPKDFDRTFLADSLCYHAVQLAEQTKAKAIINFSQTGYTAYRLSGFRPGATVYALTDNKQLMAKLSLIWGVKAFFFNHNSNIDESIANSIAYLKQRGELHNDDIVIHVGSTPIHKRDRTNMLKISYV